MKILAIETSCDETGVAIIEASGTEADFRFTVLGNALYSQIALHAQYGGVYPNLAKREHQKNFTPLLEQALTDAFGPPLSRGARGVLDDRIESTIRAELAREPELTDALIAYLSTIEVPDIDAIAVTSGPGLEPTLWVGVNAAKALSIAWNKPIVAVNHMEGHALLSAVEGDHFTAFEFPALAVLISGGHTELNVMTDWHTYKRIGETRDDAVGEAFDKVARLIGLPYPGGPQISKHAAEARAQNLPQEISLPRPMLRDDSYDFSFSGLKTAVRRVIEQTEDISEEFKMNLAREFEDAAADVIIHKATNAVEEYGIQTIIVGGGVAANTFIRQRMAETMATIDPAIKVLFPEKGNATDNALMIAIAGYFGAVRGEYAEIATLVANGNWRLAQ
jgi:N6-L-threonylcarbamoyladenine synthase